MNSEDLFNRDNIIDLSFFNFRNAITAAYFADQDFKVLKTNENFETFFPILGNVTQAYFPNILEQLGLPGQQIDNWITGIQKEGFVLIPEIKIKRNGDTRVYSLLSTSTEDENFSYLRGIQGQFVDRTAEWSLRQEREELLEQKIRDREIIEEKSRHLEHLAKRLAKYLSPQIYNSIFADTKDSLAPTTRKNLTIFFSDIEKFTDLSDTLEPEQLTAIVNNYLSEMSSIAIDCGGTIDKFIGDAILVFFGDPESEGEEEDALKCIEMGLRMQQRTTELQSHWKKLGAHKGLKVRMGITTGFCTVGSFGSEQRLDYSVLGSPVNLAARLQSLAPPGKILMTESTYDLVHSHLDCDPFSEVTPRGFSRPVQTYQVKDFRSKEHRQKRRDLSHCGNHVEVQVIDSSDTRAVIEELRNVLIYFEDKLGTGRPASKTSQNSDR
ncbi:adenylate/guanylate cyclase domain-containing protein [Rhodovibrionaceae bacterium A322]